MQRDVDFHRQGWRAVWLVNGLFAIGHLALAKMFPLLQDETYYWTWSRHLDGGYFDHPPLVAWMIRASEALMLGSRSALSVRLVSVFAGWAASMVVAATARRIAGDRAALAAAVAFNVIPLTSAEAFPAVPDSPLILFQSVALYCIVCAFMAPKRPFRWWCVAGVSVGFGLLSKYTAVLLPLSLLVAMLVRPRLRNALATPGPYVAACVALLLFSPVLWWNAHHGWASFRFQLAHGFGSQDGSLLLRELRFLIDQAAVITPIVFALIIFATWNGLRRPASDVQFALAGITLTTGVLFVLSSTQHLVQANWPAPMYPSGIVLVSMEAARGTTKQWFRFGVALSALLFGCVLIALVVAMRFVTLLPTSVSEKLSGALTEISEWDVAARSVIDLRNKLKKDQPCCGRNVSVAAGRYQDVSKLTYALSQRGVFTDVFSIRPLGGRLNQYDFWPDFPQKARIGDALILVVAESSLDEVPRVVADLARAFHHFTRGDTVPLTIGPHAVKQRRIWIFEEYNGAWPGSLAHPIGL